MPLEIAVKQGQQTMESMSSFEDLEDADQIQRIDQPSKLESERNNNL